MAARAESRFELLRAEMHERSTRIRRDMFHGAIALFAMYATLLVHALA